MAQSSAHMAVVLVACVLAMWASSALAVDVRGRLMVPEPSFSKVSLSGGKHVAIVRRDGTFTLHDVEPGVYMLDAHSKRYVFSRVRVVVKQSGKVAAEEFPYPGADKRPMGYPLVLKPQAFPMYFPARVPFNPLSYLKNPMVIIMLIAGGMMLLPKLMGEEAMEEMKKQQEEMNKQGGLAGAFGLKLPQPEADESSSDDEEEDAPLPSITHAPAPAAPTSGTRRRIARPKRGKR